MGQGGVASASHPRSLGRAASGCGLPVGILRSMREDLSGLTRDEDNESDSKRRLRQLRSCCLRGGIHRPLGGLAPCQTYARGASRAPRRGLRCGVGRTGCPLGRYGPRVMGWAPRVGRRTVELVPRGVESCPAVGFSFEGPPRCGASPSGQSMVGTSLSGVWGNKGRLVTRPAVPGYSQSSV